MCSSRQPAPTSARSSGSCSRRFPDARTECAAEPGDAHAGDLCDPAVQRALGGARVALRLDEVGPHFGAAVVVVVAEDPVYSNAAIEQWRRQFVQRPIALEIAQQDGRLRQGIERFKAALDQLPLLVDVADEDNRHCVLRSVTSEPDLDDVPAASLAFHEYPQMETG